jgi:two-component system, cell cycle response regulator
MYPIDSALETNVSPVSGAPGRRYGDLVDIARRLTGRLATAQLYTTLHEQAARLMPVGAFLIARYDAATDTATVVFADGVPTGALTSYRGSESLAICRGRPVRRLCADSQDPVCSALLSARSDLHDCVAAPIVGDEQVLGELVIFCTADSRYDDADVEHAAMLASLAAVAIDNMRRVEEIRQQQREAERLEEIGRALTESLDMELVLERVTTAALELCDADGAAVWLVDDGGDAAEAVFTAGPLALQRGLRIAVPPALLELVRTTPHALTFEDRADAAILPPAIRGMTRAVSTAMAPLLNGERLVGALSVARARHRVHRGDEAQRLDRLGIQASIAVNNARLHQQIRELSLTDPLTGLANRRHLDIFLDKEFAAAERGRPLVAIMLDIDDFKQYNDRHGHLAGDDALRGLGDVLRTETRAMNLAARLGGDEFVAILSGSEQAGALIHLERLTAAVDRHPLLGRAGIRISSGLACYSAEMKTPNDLLRAADHALYADKPHRV